jgi:hypothetical protein
LLLCRVLTESTQEKTHCKLMTMPWHTANHAFVMYQKMNMKQKNHAEVRRETKNYYFVVCVLGESTPQNHDFIVYQKKAHGKLSELSQTTTTGN